jgi:glycine/D-amino acid oxidase-like deaminating enzyme
MEDYPDTNNIMIFGTLEGEDFSKYKMGNEMNADPHLQLKIMKKLFPSSIPKIDHINACFYSVSHDDEFIFEKKGKTVYAFGLCGRGFKHMPYHGKRVYHLIKGNIKEADKYKKQEIAKL